MATYIKTLKDENGDVVLPRTSKSAIQDVINEVPVDSGAAGQVLTKTQDGYNWQDSQSTMPAPTTSDNGKFLRVVNGVAAWQTVDTMSGGSY